jgi:hypothetical protein
MQHARAVRQFGPLPERKNHPSMVLFLQPGAHIGRWNLAQRSHQATGQVPLSVVFARHCDRPALVLECRDVVGHRLHIAGLAHGDTQRRQ